MQTEADLGFLEFAQIAIGGIQKPIEMLVLAILPLRAASVVSGQLQQAQLFCQLGAQQLGPLTAHLARFPVLIHLGLEALQIPMQPRPSQGWGEVIEDHRLGPPFGLGSFARIVDNEGIEVGHGAEGPLGKAPVGEAQALAGQPLQVAVLTNMHHHMGPELLPDPEILGQVGMGGG